MAFKSDTQKFNQSHRILGKNEMVKVKLTLTMKYKKGCMFLGDWENPKLNHIPKEFEVHRAEILASGNCEFNGEKMEYQDIRVYLKEKSQ